MKMNAYITGVGMTHFGKHMDLGLKAIGGGAVEQAIADAGIAKEDLQAAYVGNAAAGLITGQECIRGEVVLRSVGIGKIPVINVENACASASTALNQAAAMVTAGLYDTVLAVGVEKNLRCVQRRRGRGSPRRNHGEPEEECRSRRRQLRCVWRW
jgi:acetyl-CoA acetyltransferase